jgi:hypothetical protein
VSQGISENGLRLPSAAQNTVATAGFQLVFSGFIRQRQTIRLPVAIARGKWEIFVAQIVTKMP